MNIDPASLAELKRICSDSFRRDLTDEELQDVGQRIIRFLVNSEDEVIPSTPVDHV